VLRHVYKRTEDKKSLANDSVRYMTEKRKGINLILIRFDITYLIRKYYPKKVSKQNAAVFVFTRHNTEHYKLILIQSVHHLQVQHIKQKKHSIKCNKIQISTNVYMLRRRRQSTKTKDYKSNAPIHVLIAQTVVIKVFKY
jgi:uncharacterized protein YhbP (UPF0306 family)